MAILTFGNYAVKPDVGGTGWMLTRRKGKPSAKSPHEVLGYFPRIGDALNRLLDERLKASSATDIRGLIEETHRFRREVAAALTVTVPEHAGGTRTGAAA